MKKFSISVVLITLFQLTTIAQNKTAISFRNKYYPVITTQYDQEKIYSYGLFNKSKIRSYNNGWLLKPSSGFELSINTKEWVRIRKVQIESTIYGWSGAK